MASFARFSSRAQELGGKKTGKGEKRLLRATLATIFKLF
jgi:hypothetical protein